MHKSIKLKAYSLIEIVVVLGIFFIMVAIALPLGIRELGVNKAQNSAFDIESALSLAQSNSYSNYKDSSYGVALFPDRYIVFNGLSLSTASNTDTFYLNYGVNITNINLNPDTTEIVFNKGELKANTNGFFDLGSYEDYYRISINSEGLINIFKL